MNKRDDGYHSTEGIPGTTSQGKMIIGAASPILGRGGDYHSIEDILGGEAPQRGINAGVIEPPIPKKVFEPDERTLNNIMKRILVGYPLSSEEAKSFVVNEDGETLLLLAKRTLAEKRKWLEDNKNKPYSKRAAIIYQVEKLNNAIEDIYKNQSNNQSNKEYFSHKSSDGSKVEDFVMEYEVEVLRDFLSNHTINDVYDFIDDVLEKEGYRMSRYEEIKLKKIESFYLENVLKIHKAARDMDEDKLKDLWHKGLDMNWLFKYKVERKTHDGVKEVVVVKSAWDLLEKSKTSALYKEKAKKVNVLFEKIRNANFNFDQQERAFLQACFEKKEFPLSQERLENLLINTNQQDIKKDLLKEALLAAKEEAIEYANKLHMQYSSVAQNYGIEVFRERKSMAASKRQISDIAKNAIVELENDLYSFELSIAQKAERLLNKFNYIEANYVDCRMDFREMFLELKDRAQNYPLRIVANAMNEVQDPRFRDFYDKLKETVYQEDYKAQQECDEIIRPRTEVSKLYVSRVSKNGLTITDV